MSYVDVKIKRKNEKKKGTWFIKATALLVVLATLTAGGAVLAKKGARWFDPISIVATVSASNLRETDGRTNLLLLGSDRRDTGTIDSELTDTLLLVSIGRVDHDVVLISLPRDLWVEDPNGAKSKINAVYTMNKQDQVGISGGEAIMSVADDVLGVPVHYYAVINFELFKNIIDILGGVEIDVERSFIDYEYPIEGKENAPNEADRYETVAFDKGTQTMDGARALKYVRSRKGTNGENTDFARSERQQRVIAAIKGRALSLETLVNPVKIKELYEIYSTKIDTNVTFSDVQSFYLLSQQIDFDQVVSIVLDDRSAADEGGLLYAPTENELYGGAYVLIPKVGNFSQLHAYVQRYLFSQK